MTENKWRPEGFDAGAIAAKVLQGRGITNPVYWASSVMCALVEAGADAVIYPQSIIGIDFSLLNHMSDSLQAKHFALCNDPPAVKSEPQLMICPKAKECKCKYDNCWHSTPHTADKTCTENSSQIDCPSACVPYVPEKWVDETLLNHQKKLDRFNLITVKEWTWGIIDKMNEMLRNRGLK